MAPGALTDLVERQDVRRDDRVVDVLPVTEHGIAVHMLDAE
jgi:hypothetical protein